MTLRVLPCCDSDSSLTVPSSGWGWCWAIVKPSSDWLLSLGSDCRGVNHDCGTLRALSDCGLVALFVREPARHKGNDRHGILVAMPRWFRTPMDPEVMLSGWGLGPGDAF